MKKYPEKNNASDEQQDFSESDFSQFENDDDIVDGDFNGFDEEADEGRHSGSQPHL